MKNIIKIITSFALVIVAVAVFVACGKNNDKNCETAEKVELASATFGEVEFENGEGVNLKQECDVVTISGMIDKMSESQKMEFGVEDVSHVVVLKFKFDREKTIKSFEIKGEMIKVYSDDESVENHAGSLEDVLDSAAGEDAYSYLILSAKSKNYELTTTYTDESQSVIKVNVTASLAEGNS